MTAAAMLDASGLGKTFATRAGELVVLRDVELRLEKGSTLAIVGPSGCGKSTLLHILGTLDRPTSGTVRLDGIDPFALGDADLASFRNRHIGFVFQDHHLLPQLSVVENVLMPSLAPGAPRAIGGEAVAARAARLVERVGLGERENHLPAELSGGERQRVSIARALLLAPRLLLADEPTGNLDSETASRIGELLLEVQREEESLLIVVTHSSDLAARFDRVGVLDRGALNIEERR